VATALVAAAFAFPALAAAEPGEEGALVESLAPARQGPWEHWSRQRLEEAEPLPIITLPGPESPTTPESSSAASSEAASTAALRAAVAGQGAATEGVEIAAAESTLFPNSANGKLFGTFKIEEEGTVRYQDYVCSASVVKSPHGDVIVTAAHCLLDPETRGKATFETIFVPGYRNKTMPYGAWRAEYQTLPESWKKTVESKSIANEGVDLAFLNLMPNKEGEEVEEAVGSLEIGFDAACNQTYTQFGYPAESPYNGELLYSHTAGYAGIDTNTAFSPVPMKIASDFTRGASGGPWATGIGTASPTVRSLTAYGYANQPGYLFGPYFGETAKKAYGTAIGQILPAGIEERCAALPTPPIPTPPTPTPPTPTPPTEATPVVKPVTLKVTRVRRRANGSAVLTAKVNTAGILQLSGTAVRGESLGTPAAGQYRLVVAPKGPTTRRLRQVGKAKVGVKVAFSASGKTKSVSRKIRLSRPSVARAAQRRPSRTR
jgi:hypothetical protein